MAAGTSLPESPRTRTVSDSGTHVIECDRYIESELSRTRRQVKGVDLASSCMLLAVATLVYLMLTALADHWLISGGLGHAGRVAAFVFLAVGVMLFAVLRFVPLLIRRVNPVYAAYTIERNRPGIKNSLINFLLLRSDEQRLPERIYQAMEVQAANALTSTHAEVAVDRTPLIRLLMAMVAVVFCIALYAVFSPKNPFTSFRRVVSPWADVAPPTRVSIRDVQPGDGRGFHDQHVPVTAQVDGLRGGEAVNLRYSTVDGQVVGRSVAMNVPESSYRYTTELPPDNLGLQQDLEYWIEAGDAITPHYRIKVDTSPTIMVEEIEYEYPKYSELPPRKVARHGDIQALAGTRVTLRAKANQLIRQASVDFECDGRNDLDMRIDGTKAEVSFPLVWNEKERRVEHASYQLRFRNEEGHENPKPIRYAIEVIRDVPPEVEFVEPELDPSKELVVPSVRPVGFTVQAADLDFKLSSVKFFARRDGTPLAEETLLAEPRGGQFKRDYLLDLRRLSVKPGEEVEFWAAADDNREPAANHSETPHYRLRVAAPDKNQNQQDQAQDGNPDNQRKPKQGQNDKSKPSKRQNGDQNQEGEQDGQPGEQQPQDKNQSGGKQGKQQQRDQKNDGSSDGKQQDQGQQEGSEKQQPSGDQQNQSENESGEGSNTGNSEQQSGKQGAGQQSGKDDSKRLDPQRDAGKAIDEINKHFDQKAKNEENQPDQKSPAEKSQGGSKQQEGEKGGGPNDSQQKEGSEKPGKQQGEKQPGKQQGDKQPGKKQSDKQPGEKQSGQPESGEKQSGEKSSQKKQDGQKQSDKQQGDDTQKDGSGQTGDKNESGQKKSAKQKPDKKQDKNGALADKKNDKQAGAGEQGSAGGEAEKGEGEKNGQQGSKGGKQPSKGDQQAKGDEQRQPNDGGEKSTKKDESGGGKEGEATAGDEREKNADGETKPRPGQGGQAKGPGERDDTVKKHEGESPDQKGGDQESSEKGEGGAGDSEGANKHGAPSPHTDNKPREKKQLSPDAKKGTTEDEPESASDTKRESDSTSGQQGDRDGGGKSGGGQRSNSEGTGSAGQNSEADQGGGKGETQGKGATGDKGGDQQKSDKPTGGKPSGEKGSGTNQGKGEQSNAGEPSDSPETADARGHNNQPRDKRDQGDNKQPPGEKQSPKDQQGQKQPKQGSSNADKQSPDGERSPSDRGGYDVRGGKQRSNPVDGGQPGQEETTEPAEPDNSEPGGDDPNLDYARKATDLALDRLKDQLAKGKPDPELMEKLKWTPEDMQRFYDQWERLKKSADESGPKGDAARQEFDDALRSLGLRPKSTSLSGSQKRDDSLRNLRDRRRSAPPPEFQEQWIEFNKATAKTRK